MRLRDAPWWSTTPASGWHISGGRPSPGHRTCPKKSKADAPGRIPPGLATPNKWPCRCRLRFVELVISPGFGTWIANLPASERSIRRDCRARLSCCHRQAAERGRRGLTLSTASPCSMRCWSWSARSRRSLAACAPTTATRDELETLLALEEAVKISSPNPWCRPCPGACRCRGRPYRLERRSARR